MPTAVESQSLLLQLLDPSNRASPYPAYTQIRERGPLQLPAMTLHVYASFRTVISFTGQAPDSIDDMFQGRLWLRGYLRDLADAQTHVWAKKFEKDPLNRRSQ
jgi:hypothetical protein